MIGPYSALDAVNAQLYALQMVDSIFDGRLEAENVTDDIKDVASEYQPDRVLLRQATPFAWSKDTTAAVLAASKSIPLDTVFNAWNIGSEALFWHFEQPLPFVTAYYEDKLSNGVRGLLMGVIRNRDGSSAHRVHLSMWIDDIRENFLLMPSQVDTCFFGDTLGNYLEYQRTTHRKLYGPGGKWANKPQIGEDKFCEAAEGILRFMLAGFAWMNQKIVSTESVHVERHRRKEFERKTGRKADLRVVQLRKTAYQHSSDVVPVDFTEEEKQRWYNVRFVVDGHWRNQACGPKMGERRLTYVHSYLKGPDDAPLLVAPKKVYAVRK